MLFWNDLKIMITFIVSELFQDATAETKLSLVTIIYYANISLKIGYSIIIHESDYIDLGDKIRQKIRN